MGRRASTEFAAAAFNLQRRQPNDVPLAFEAELCGRVWNWLDQPTKGPEELGTEDTGVLTLKKSWLAWHPQDRRPPNINERGVSWWSASTSDLATAGNMSALAYCAFCSSKCKPAR